MDSLLGQLRRDFPAITFTAGNQFYWSPKSQEIMYSKTDSSASSAPWSLLHELGHALLDHTSYESDLELIEMESQAWEKAKEIGQTYGFTIEEDHIQDCMDTYRDWLHQRSACPRCDNRSLQQDDQHYRCFNCGTTWKVSLSRFCRPYRMVKQTKTSPSSVKTTFA
jgi:hypothetical protein